jgi:hypothetical protein
MSDFLVNIIEKYKARSGDEQDFMDKHTDNVEVTTAPGGEKGKEASEKMKKADRKNTRQGYEPGEDEEYYESRQMKDSKKEMMVSKGGKVEVIDKKDWESYKKKGYIVAEDFGVDLDTMLSIIDEAVAELSEELTEDEKLSLDEMLSTPEGYQDLINSIFEEKDEDEDEYDDDEEEKIVEKNPKVKKSMKK